LPETTTSCHGTKRRSGDLNVRGGCGRRTFEQSHVAGKSGATEEMFWLNEPDAWELSDSGLWVHAMASTDFWRQTHYGYTRDSGHFFYRPVQGDFRASVKVSGDFSSQFDQAGLMVRLDADRWIKAGPEFVDGDLQFSVVATNSVSDWSMLPIGATGSILVSVQRAFDSVAVACSTAEGKSYQARLSYLDPAKSAMVGVMCCSPEGTGFHASFSGLEFGPC